MSAEVWTVGQYGTITIALGGTVTALSADVVEIDGIAVPRTLGPGPSVRYLSCDLPPDLNDPCPACAVAGTAQLDVSEEIDKWVDLIRREHDEAHLEAWAICGSDLCRAAKA